MASQADPAASASGSPNEKRAAAEPSGPNQTNPSTAGPGETRIHSDTPENRLGHLDPSAPGNTSTTPGTTGEK